MAKVSVIIPAYNHERFLSHAIESALGQTHPPHEVIVVDDGSSDATPEVLRKYAAQIRAHRQQNAGVSAARNRGAALASGELLAFLDADDLWLPEKLERQVARLTPGVGLVHCGVEDIDASGTALRRHGEGMEGAEGEVADEMLLFRRPTILGGGSGVLIPRAAFDAVGGFDPRLSTSADWDLYYRLARRYKVAFAAEILLQYRLHGSNMHGNIDVMERDMLVAYRKAFQDPGGAEQRLRRRAYGNLHMVLAGSYFSVGNRHAFLRHAVRSVWLTPGNAARFASYPLRLIRRHTQAVTP